MHTITKVGLLSLALICAAIAPVRSEPLADHPLAFGLNGISDWSTQHPFIDVMKTARPWIGHLPDQWGGINFEVLAEQGVLDENGWPRLIPAQATKLETLILTEQPKGAVHLTGEYELRYDGRGEINVTGRGRPIVKADGYILFAYTPGPGAVGIAIEATRSDDPIRNIRVVKRDHRALHEAGKRFNPDWIARIAGVNTVRFMDWMATNNSLATTFSELPKIDDFSYAWRGVPLTVMIELANELDAHPWFTIPHRADDDLVQRFARQTKDHLKPGLTAHVEYSNEVWNFIFDQSRWAQAQADAIWGELQEGWMQFYGLRAAQVMDIWTEAFGTEAQERLRRIVSVHTGWPGLEAAILHGKEATAVKGKAPVESFDAYAVTGYFGYELGTPETLDTLLDDAQRRAEEAGRANGLSRVALREFIAEHRFDGVAPEAAAIVRSGSLWNLTRELWPYHARVAQEAGLDLIMYEGGTHAAPLWEAVENERLVSFLTQFSYSQDMADLYVTALELWSSQSADGFNAFVDVAPPSKWGSWGALRHLNDDNPRWRALMSPKQ